MLSFFTEYIFVREYIFSLQLDIVGYLNIPQKIVLVIKVTEDSSVSAICGMENFQLNFQLIHSLSILISAGKCICR